MCGFVNESTDRMASLQDDMKVSSHNISSFCLPKLHHRHHHGLSSGFTGKLSIATSWCTPSEMDSPFRRRLALSDVKVTL